MTARRDRREDIARLARASFEHHVLKEIAHGANGAPTAWKCYNPRPDAFGYWFLVLVGPGAIVQYGDVGDLAITQGSSYDLAWLEGAIDSLDYVLEKSWAKRDEFVPEMFQQYVAEHKPDFEFEYDGGELDAHRYWEETGDTEFSPCCRDWPIEALWGYHALAKFIELRKAARRAA